MSVMASPKRDIDYRGDNPFAKEILRKDGVCKLCNGTRVVKNGKKHGKQQYRCKKCGHQFTNPERLLKTRFDKEIIAFGLELYYEGLSLRKCVRMLWKIFKVRVGTTTLWDWIQRYTPLVKEFTQTLIPKSKRGVWHVDETWIHMKGKDDSGMWYWDCIDRDSRFIVGTYLSRTKYIEDAEAFFKDAKKGSHRRPNTVICDGLPAYNKGLKKAYGWKAWYHSIDLIQWAGIAKEMPSNNNRIERYHNTIKQRTKVMRGMQNPLGILDGHTIHYNFIRPHMTLGTTPARIAGIRLPFENGWSDLIRWSTYHRTLVHREKSLRGT